MNKANFLPKFTIIALLMACLCSCAQLKHRPLIADESKETHAKIVYKYTHDTVHLQDSSITTFRNDTIFAEKWHTKYIAKIVKDTVRATDTVMVTKIETKEVKIKPTLKEKIEEYMLIFIIFVSLYIIAKIIWKKI